MSPCMLSSLSLVRPLSLPTNAFFFFSFFLFLPLPVISCSKGVWLHSLAAINSRWKKLKTGENPLTYSALLSRFVFQIFLLSFWCVSWSNWTALASLHLLPQNFLSFYLFNYHAVYVCVTARGWKTKRGCGYTDERHLVVNAH